MYFFAQVKYITSSFKSRSIFNFLTCHSLKLVAADDLTLINSGLNLDSIG